MTLSTGLTSGRYIRHWLDLMSSRGIDPAELLAGSGLALNQFDAQPPYLTQSQVEQMFANAYRITGNACLGIEFGFNLNFAAHGPLGFAGLTARTVREALEQMVHYMPLVTSLIRLGKHLDESHQLYHIQVMPRPGVNVQTADFLVQTVMCSIYVMTRFLLGNQVEVTLNWQCPGSDIIREQFRNTNTRLHFNCSENTLVGALDLLATPVVLADEPARRHAIEMCEAEMRELEKQTSLSHRIYMQLLDNHQNMPGIEQISKQLHLSTRTVHRRLKDDGTCYRDLVNAARMTLARQYLARDGLSITEVAYLLGYGDSANFTRAFKRSNGVTPTQFLEQPADSRSA